MFNFHDNLFYNLVKHDFSNLINNKNRYKVSI
jgi:hypothetical protein